LNADNCPLLPITHVEMGRRMIVVVRPYRRSG
jgi:hypothetical protein